MHCLFTIETQLVVVLDGELPWLFIVFYLVDVWYIVYFISSKILEMNEEMENAQHWEQHFKTNHLQKINEIKNLLKSIHCAHSRIFRNILFFPCYCKSNINLLSNWLNDVSHFFYFSNFNFTYSI